MPGRLRGGTCYVRGKTGSGAGAWEQAGHRRYLNNLEFVAFDEGDYSGARALYEESLALQREIGNKMGLASSLARLGGVALGAGQIEKGANLLGAAEGLLQSIGARPVCADRLFHERAAGSARTLLGVEAFERASQEGRALTIDRAIKLALERTPAS